MFEESADFDDEPQAEEELSALSSGGLRDMHVALKKIKANAQDESFGLEDRLNVLSNVLGVEMESRSLDDLPSDQFDMSRKPRHAGYHAWTRLVFSKLAVPVLFGFRCNYERYVGGGRHGDHRGDSPGVHFGGAEPKVGTLPHS